MKHKLLVLMLCLVLLAVTAVMVHARPGAKDFNYKIVEVEGMTCIYVEKSRTIAGGYGYGYAALTCNWDEYISPYD